MANCPSLREISSFWKELEGFCTRAKEGGQMLCWGLDLAINVSMQPYPKRKLISLMWLLN